MFWRKKTGFYELNDRIDKLRDMCYRRLTKLEEKFHTHIHTILPVGKSWKEVFDQLNKIKRTLKRYNPNEVEEIVITSRCIKIVTYHLEDKVIKLKSKTKGVKNAKKPKR